MKNLLFVLLATCTFLIPSNAISQCQALFEFEQLDNSLSVHFINHSTSEHDITVYNWTFGDSQTSHDQNPTHAYAAPGTYEVCLMIHDNHDCESTICHEVVVAPLSNDCEASFEFEINQANNTVHFFNHSTSPHDIVSHIWDFGDGHDSDGLNPTHIYDQAGTYLVCLTITDATGCVDDVCHEVVILEDDNCEAFFEADQTDNPLIWNFLDASTSDHDITHWHWDFGDDHDSNDQDPSHTYAHAGTYEVCLTIISETGCEDTYCHSVIIEDGEDHCEAAFTVEGTNNPLEYHFFDHSTSDHDIIHWVWHFGDGSMSDNHNPSHVYAAPGVYHVCLVITSETGCVDEVCHDVEVGEGGDHCEAEFNVEGTENPLEYHFFDQSSSDHDISHWVWHFGDGSMSDQHNPTHVYAAPGVYHVCLVITSETGCVDEVCHDVEVGEGGDHCEASFEIQETEDPFTFHFIDHSSSDHQIVSWVWNFGDGQTGDGQNPTHTYSAPGTYTVCLIITSETGCVADRCHQVVIGNGNEDCNALFTIGETEDPYTFHFIDHSTSEHTIILWLWNFHDGSPIDTNQNPTHTFPHDGTYEVCLTTLDEAGCEAHYCHPLVINHEEEGCNAAFYWTYNHDTDSLVFHNTSTGATDHTTWLWSFGDGSTSDQFQPQHEYAEDGLYTICLIMTDTTTDCVSDVCHTYFQETNEDAQNDEQEEEGAPNNFNDPPIFRYTNPASDQLHLVYNVRLTGSVRLELFDFTGARVINQDLGTQEKGNYTTDIPISNLLPGIYSMVLTSAKDRIVKNVVVNRN